MFDKLTAAAPFLALALLAGCGHAQPEGTGPVVTPPEPLPYHVRFPPKPGQPGQPGATQVAIGAVSLGDWCPAVAAQAPSQGAASRVAGAPARMHDAPADMIGQSSGCQVVLSVDGAGGGQLRVVSAMLIDDAGRRVQALTAGAPRIWNGQSYQPWNQQVGAGDSQVLFSLSGLDWNRVPGSYQRTFRVELVVEVDGATSTLTSPDTVREAMIVT